MKSPARFGWLVAILLALSLIAPFTSPATAAQPGASPIAPVTESPTSVSGQTPVPTGTSVPTQDETGAATDPAVDQPAEESDAPEEPVVSAALGSLKVYSKNAANEDVPGATYAILDGACAAVLAGPAAADAFGTITFTDVAAQGANVCISVTVTPAGYLDPAGLVITMSATQALTEWSFVFTAAPIETYDLPIFKEDSQTHAKLGGAGFTLYGGACPAIGIGSDEQFTGPADAVDGSAGRTIFSGLAAGTYCVVETTAPSGYTGGGSATVVLPDNASGWTFQNDRESEPTYDLPIFKEDRSTGGKLGGVGFTLYYGVCGDEGAAVGPEQFTGPADAVDGSAGRTIFTGLPVGNYCAVETTAPSGYTVSDPVTLNLPENQSGWTFLDDPIPAQSYDLPIFKENSQTHAKIGGAGFTVYYGACDEAGAPIGPEQFTGDADASDGSAGRTIFLQLPEGTYCVAETTVPNGFTGGDRVTVNLPENTSGWTVLNDPIAAHGTLRITKHFCAVTDERNAGTYFFENSAGGIDCIFGAASFYVYPQPGPSEPIGPITTSSESGQAHIDLTPGNYVLEEIGSGATTAFSIEADETTAIPVYNLVYDEGSLYVTKIYCKAKYDTTDITFDYPVDVSAAWDWGHKPKCWQGDANFEVWLFGDPENVISFHTGSDGEVWLVLPATTSATGPHKLVETDTGAWAWFEVLPGAATYATVTNYFKAYHPHPQPPVTPVPTGPGTVTTLPATGSGSSDANGWMLLGVGGAALAGLIGIGRWRKPRRR